MTSALDSINLKTPALIEMYDGELTGTIIFQTYDDLKDYFHERTAAFTLVGHDRVGNVKTYTFIFETPDFIQHQFEYIIIQ